MLEVHISRLYTSSIRPELNSSSLFNCHRSTKISRNPLSSFQACRKDEKQDGWALLSLYAFILCTLLLSVGNERILNYNILRW
jgi:hypothetical protein